MGELTVEPRGWEHGAGVLRRTAIVTRPDGHETELWIEVPEAREAELADDAEPWLLATIHLAMLEGWDLRVRGAVSPSLLANLEEYMAAFEGWSRRERWPGSAVFRRVGVHADELQERTRPSGEAICAFSGGIDSTFTIARHLRGDAGNATRDIRATLMVAGFDIPISEPDVFRSAVARARVITDDLGVPLIEARTNLRVLDLHWPEVFPGAVVALLSTFGGRFGVGMLSTGRTWDWIDLPDDGSSPAWDWALGSDAFTVVHDGAAFDRPEKVAALADWDAARRNVRFCWAGAQLDRNCGRCRKCIGTYLLFRSLGIPPDCFDEVPADDELADLVALRRPGWTIAARYAESLLGTARSRGIDEPWVRALEWSLFKDRRLDDVERVRRVGGARWAQLRASGRLPDRRTDR